MDEDTGETSLSAKHGILMVFRTGGEGQATGGTPAVSWTRASGFSPACGFPPSSMVAKQTGVGFTFSRFHVLFCSAPPGHWSQQSQTHGFPQLSEERCHVHKGLRGGEVVC